MQGNMWQNYAGPWTGPGMGFVIASGALAFLVVVLWSLFWKGKALWHAARKGDTLWFVILLVVNTLGILEILYLYVFTKKSRPVS